MKILLLGKDGQLGWELQRSLSPLCELIALGRSGPEAVDFTSLSALEARVRAVAPDVIVNAAAYTAVDRAEFEKREAYLINAEAPGVLAHVARDLGSYLVHYSTDYVFDGSGSDPRREDAKTGPLNYYGETKLIGEKNISASRCKYLIFRTSWVYATRGENFAKTILRLANERDRLQIINDQIGTPTGADLLADVTAHALRTAISNNSLLGTYHVTAAGETSWYDYARHVLSIARAAGVSLKVSDSEVVAVSSSDFTSAAARPANSRLDTRKLQERFNMYLPEWQFGVNRMLAEILQN